MNEEFIKNIYETVVEDGRSMYQPFEIDVKINGVSTDAELQDYFLGFTEDNIN